MKILLLSFLLMGCVGTYRQASFISGQTYVGMPKSKFLKIAGRKARIEAMEFGYTIYRMNDYDSFTGAIIDTKFFYFDDINDMLYKIDGGEFRQKRYQVEIINR